MKKSLLLVLVLSIFLASGVGAITSALVVPYGGGVPLTWYKQAALLNSAVTDSSYVSLAAGTAGTQYLNAGTADTLNWIDMKMSPAAMADLADSTKTLLYGVVSTSMVVGDSILCTWEFSMNEDKSNIITCSKIAITANGHAVTAMRGNGGATYYPPCGARWTRVIMQAYDSSLTAITGVRFWIQKMKGI